MASFRTLQATAALGLIATITVLAEAVPAADLQDARSIMERNFFAPKIKHFTNDNTITLINDNGQERIRKTRAVSTVQPNGIDSMVLIRILFPGDVEGTGFLQIQHHDGDDDMWIFLPAVKKVRRLSTSNKKDSFVGSEFSYGDMLQPIVDTYQYKLLRSEILGGEDCYVVESVSATEQFKKDYGYAKKIVWIRKTNFMEKKIDYYDTAERLLKTQVIPEVKEIDAKANKWTALRREMTNHQTGHRTTMTFTNLDTTQPVGEQYFNTRTLEREK